jgi:hypothetical protein
MNSQHRVKEVGQADPMCLGNKTKKCTVSVKTPGNSGGSNN